MTECSSDGCRFNENCVASGSTGFCEAIQFNTGIKDAEGLEFGGISFVTEDNLDCLKEQGLFERGFRPHMALKWPHFTFIMTYVEIYSKGAPHRL